MTNSLLRFSERTLQFCKFSLLLAAHAAFIQENTFQTVTDDLQLGFRLFLPRLRDAFQLSLTILIRYRSLEVFRVGV